MSEETDALLERSIRLGWASFKSAWALLLVAVLAAGFASVPGAVIGQIGQIAGFVLGRSGWSARETFILFISVAAFGQVVAYLTYWPAYAGALVAAVRAQRGHRNDFRALFSGFRRFPSVVGASFVCAVLAAAAWFPFAYFVVGAFEGMLSGASQRPDLSQVNIPGAVIAALVATVLNFLVYARLGLAPLRAADPDLPKVGAVEALRYAFELTRGRTMIAIGMTILTGTVLVLSVLLCGIGVLLVGQPLALALNAGFYRALRRESDPPPLAHAPWSGAVPPQTPV
jgi:hypothetical protein